jgi:hypothetical protein
MSFENVPHENTGKSGLNGFKPTGAVYVALGLGHRLPYHGRWHWRRGTRTPVLQLQ